MCDAITGWQKAMSISIRSQPPDTAYAVYQINEWDLRVVSLIPGIWTCSQCHILGVQTSRPSALSDVLDLRQGA